MRTGRPRLSKEETRRCPACGTEFVVPSWDPRVYCNRACYRKGSAGQQRRLGQRTGETKTCPVCGEDFYVPPSLARVATCSRKCAATLRSGVAHELREMTCCEAAWLGGLFDGEGSIAIVNRKSATSTSIRISVPNTNHALVQRIRDVTGVGTIMVRKTTNPRHRPVAVWQCYSATAIAVLRVIRPWLIEKAQRADDVFAGRTFPRQDRWTEDNLPRGRPPAS